jgi:hypothetical protein
MEKGSPAWEALEQFLLGLEPGDEVQVAKLSQITGLDVTTCDEVLRALARVELFTPNGDVFVRRRIFDALNTPSSQAPHAARRYVL